MVETHTKAKGLFLRHPSLAQAGEIGVFEQSADLRLVATVLKVPLRLVPTVPMTTTPVVAAELRRLRRAGELPF